MTFAKRNSKVCNLFGKLSRIFLFLLEPAKEETEKHHFPCPKKTMLANTTRKNLLPENLGSAWLEWL